MPLTPSQRVEIFCNGRLGDYIGQATGTVVDEVTAGLTVSDSVRVYRVRVDPQQVWGGDDCTQAYDVRSLLRLDGTGTALIEASLLTPRKSEKPSCW